MEEKRKNKGNVPNLRFPGFEGEWLDTKFSNVGEFFKGKGISKNELTDDGQPCILYGELYTKYKDEVINEVQSRTTLNPKDLIKSKANDIIIPSSGESAIDIATACCVNLDNILLGGDLNIIRPHKDNGNFISYQLNGRRKREIAKLSQGSSVVHLYNDGLKKLNLFLPTNIKEQNKIADILSLIDNRIQTQSKIINQLESLIKGIGKDLFSRKIRFNKFKGDWHRTRLHDECDINPKSGNLNNQFIYIDLESVQRGQLVKRQMMNKSTAPSRADRVLKDRDVLFQCVRPYQMNNYIYFKTDDLQWVASTGYALIRTSHNSRFIYYLINQSSFNKEVMIRCTGTSYPAISSSDLGEIKIEICSIEEQHAIAGLLSSIDEKLKLALQLNKMYQIQKNFLLSNLFI